ncbi:betaine-aldehyde dehydrogenase [Inquilinus limosus]|uniref:betaine-aldehyde dehydrogenase n=1 Tax=Inquilinus limosus TaxID=171674 RepID=UPI003F182115
MAGIIGLHIGGQSVEGSGTPFDTINPATGQAIGRVAAASPADVDRAVAAAKAAFDGWAGMTGTQRGRILREAVRLLRANRDRLARMEVADTGKPIAEALAVDIDSGADAIEYFAGLAPSLHGTHHDFGRAFAYTRREPLGVVAGIGAWNYPLQIACWKSGPALACGNTMVFKPSELTPMTAVALAQIFAEAGLPPGVFNVVQGKGDVGQALISHPDIAKVSLTGSVPTGRKVAAAAAGAMKHVTMELGGKSPLIIFADADVENAVKAAMMANFYTQGEICSNGTRVFVEASLHNRFMDALVARTQKMRIGDPMDPETQVGALISADHRAKVLGYVEAGVKAGARLICGGRAPADPALAGGYFVEPAIFDACHDDMTIVQEEIFGPVMTVLTFADEDEVVRRANATEYGLAAGVFTRDLARGHRVVARLQAGTCWINNYNITPVEIPFGGYKQSGLGRENGLAALEHYTQLKSVYVETGDVDCPY